MSYTLRSLDVIPVVRVYGDRAPDLPRRRSREPEIVPAFVLDRSRRRPCSVSFLFERSKLATRVKTLLHRCLLRFLFLSLSQQTPTPTHRQALFCAGVLVTPKAAFGLTKWWREYCVYPVSIS